MGGLDFSRSLRLRLALAVGAYGDPVIGHYFFECRRIVIFLSVQPGPFRGLQSLRDGDIRIGFGLLGLDSYSSGNNQTDETDVSDESLWGIGILRLPVKRQPMYAGWPCAPFKLRLGGDFREAWGFLTLSS